MSDVKENIAQVNIAKRLLSQRPHPLFSTLVFIVLSLIGLTLTWFVLVPLLSDYLLPETVLFSSIGLWLLICATVLYFLIRLNNHAAPTSPTTDYYQQLFIHNPEAQLIYDPRTLDIVASNKAAQPFICAKNSLQPFKNLTHVFNQTADPQSILTWLAQPDRDAESPPDSLAWKIKDGRRAEFTVIQSHLVDSQQGFRCLQLQDNSKFRRYIIDIQRSAKRLDVARDVSGMGCWEIDLDAQEVFCCNNVIDVLGLSVHPNEPIALDQFKQMANTKVLCDIAEQLTKQSTKDEIMQEQCLKDNLGRNRHLLIHAHYYRHNQQGSIIGTLLDETERKETEETIEQQRLQWNNLVETLPEGIAIIQHNRLVYVNQAILEMSEADSLEQLSAQPLVNFIDPKDMSNAQRRMENIYKQEGQTEGFFPRTFVKLNGQKFEGEVAARLIKFEGKDAIQIVVRDLTAPIKAKEALESANRRLASLSSKTLALLESERKRISGELHDDVGQSLTAIKLAIQWLTRRLTDQKLIKKTQDIQDICAETLETVRNLSLMLRPAQLDSQGLPQAIEWQVNKLFADSTIEFQLDDSGYRELSDKDAEIIAFRVIQESITNIVRHAHATTVEVKLVTEPLQFNFSITDDGVGFDVEKQSDSVGLVNMKERVELTNGRISIRSLLGVGTVINVSLPLNINQQQLESNID